MRLLSRNCLDEIASSHCLSEGAITLALSGHQTERHRGIRTLRPAVMCAAQKMLRLCLRWVKSGKALSEHIPSGLPPRADIVDAFWQVRFVPEAAVSNRSNAALLDHLVGARQQRRRHFDAERLGGLEIDQQLEFGGLINRDVAWFGPLRIWCTSSAMRLSSSARSTA
jgi:hypothetical protein